MKANMPILTRSVAASAVLLAFRAVTSSGAYPAAGGYSLGFTRSDANPKDWAPVDVTGTALATAGGSFAMDDPLMVGIDGKLVLHDGTASKHVVARAMEASSGDGVVVEVMCITSPLGSPAAPPPAPTPAPTPSPDM